MKKIINVTAGDIERAKKLKQNVSFSASQQCPIALAAKRLFKDNFALAGACAVHLKNGMLNIKNNDVNKIQKFTKKFDIGGCVKPMKLVVELCEV